MKKIAPDRSAGSLHLLDTLHLTGSAFFDALCTSSRMAFGAQTVMIASLGIVEVEHLFVEMACSEDPTFDLLQFSAAHTPCAKVIKSDAPIFVLENVSELYPDAIALPSLGTQACIVLPLKDTYECVIGVLVMEWADPISENLVDRIMSAMDPYLLRISDELKRKVLDHVIPTLMNPIDPVPDHDDAEAFRTIVRQAVELTNVHAAIVAYRADKDASKFCILAANCAGENLDRYESTCLEYANTPCQHLIKSDVYFQDRDLIAHHPNAVLLKDLGATSYLGFGFENSAGQTVGHIAFVHNRPMRASVKQCQVMGVIASRAGQELQRFMLERERDSMERALYVRSKLESLGTMAGTIAHDFNNQLTAMIGNTEMAMMELVDGHPAHTYLKNAEGSMWRARDVIADIMDFAGNHENAALERTSLGEVIASAINEFKPRLRAQSSISAEIPPGLPDILGRRVQIFQIMTNLIANGLDALDDASHHKVNITARQVQITPSEVEKCLTGQCAKLPKKAIRIDLQDTGKGMDRAKAERIFDPFFSTKGVSRGLGLSSVLGIARRLQIGLTFETSPGVGTTFHLYFAPFDVAKSPTEKDTAQVPRIPSNPSSNKIALVVDDEKSVRRVVSQILSLRGYKVLTASSGEEAIAVAQSQERIDALIVDVVMPGLDGFETLSALRKTNPDLPAVIVSGFSERGLARSFPADERVKFLVKPFGAKALRGAIDNVLAVAQLSEEP